ncbi:MAG: hypothetical protein QOG57_381 [Pseudonocardiales bacterium]|nr:hypothetical protein [Pseudonocardiales bacterium]
MAEASLDQGRQERHGRDDPGAGGQRGDRRTREVGPAEQSQIQHRRPPTQFDDDEHRAQHDTADQ